MNKCAFVTGASRGIGRGIALALAKEGYDIAFTYNSKLDEANIVKGMIEQMGRRCFFYQASLEYADVPEKVTNQAVSDLGRIDVLVCNAGLTIHNSLLTVTAETIDFTYGLDYRSYILCAKVAANDMVKNGTKGSIIFITSTRGIRAYPEDCLYGGFKSALHRSCESMALEMSQYGITVNCVAPGAIAIRGDFTHDELVKDGRGRKVPLGRAGSPNEIADMVVYLASDKARYMTGDVIKVDGGLILPGVPEGNNFENGAWSKPPSNP